MEEITQYVQNQLIQAPFRLKSYTQDEQGKKYPQRNIYVKVDKYFREFLHNPNAQDRWIIIPGLRGVGKTTIFAQLFLNHRQEVGDRRMLYISLDEVVNVLGSSLKDVLVGYEDFNIILTTVRGKYFVKVFAVFRDKKNCERYAQVMAKVIEAGVNHPAPYQSVQGNLYTTKLDGVELRLCAMEYAGDKSFYQLKSKPTLEDVKFFAQQAARINQIDFEPLQVYDSWSLINLPQEFSKKKQYLEAADRELLEKVVVRFRAIDLTKLPQCFVHGDIIKTNIIKNSQGKIFILDFAVANVYPRIQELAVLLCGIFFDEEQPESFQKYYDLVLAEYQKYIPLEPQERTALPVFVQAMFAMYVLAPTYSKVVQRNNTPENEYWLKLGKRGLQQTLEDAAGKSQKKLTNRG
ncbi:MAG: hypothetical protein A3F54_02490 [Candidatus Kerfeldbacteria bacterium RIFCSPHIGHO2_12_FULL_48_17]|uniref:Aminoglycoside phosphotransferase domain-containing protein n=1 Tax=Candidatus Kerfeldbacteria bacterium RIFCSPHIGHO2_12_FULL_48_17 TaxID=1798542 RepID=A0A1G2AXQ5_9BACT|nr:MAG: hypothetical protein A3F54_02490 [Candidatus Kerfeldbacteria bacterium RIFCSPHIGHO2_12_FULL_48_17]